MDDKEEVELNNEENLSIQESSHKFLPFDAQRNSSPPMAMDIPGQVANSIVSTEMQPYQKALDVLPEKERERKGYLATTAHTFKDVEAISHAIDFGYHKYESHQLQSGLENQNPEQNVTPEGWTPYEIENFVGIPEQYHPYIGESKSPMMLEARQQEVARLMKDDEEYADGSLMGKITGFTGAIVADAWLFKSLPMANSVQYARYSQSILQNMARQAPGVAIGTLAYTAAIDSTTVGKTMKDFVQDAAINTVAGIALTGGAAGLSRSLRGGQMYEARHALKMNFQGIEAKQVISESGELEGWRAVAGPNMAGSAMEVSSAQEFLDSRFAKKGLFAIPYVGTGLEKTLSKFTPLMRALTSDWGIERAYMNRLSNHSIITKGVEEGQAKAENFEYMLDKFRANSIQMKTRINGYMNEANGMGGEGGVAAIKRLKQRISEGNPMFDESSWGETVMASRLSGEKSEISAVNNLNDEITEHQNALLGDYQRTHGLEEMDLPVKTAADYLTRRYPTDHMSTVSGAESWDNTIVDWLTQGDEQISQANSAMNSIQESIERTRENIHAGIDADASRASLLQQNKALIKAKQDLKREIRQDIADENKGGLQNLLLENILPTEADETFLRNILKPHQEAERELSTAKGRLTASNKKVSSLKKKFESGPQAGKEKDYSALKKQITEAEKNQKSDLEEFNNRENEVRDEWITLMDDVESGKIRRALYYRDAETGRVSFKDPNATPKFRPVYSEKYGHEARDYMLTDAQAHRAKITGTSSDKIAEQMMSTLEARVQGSPLKERSLLIPDTILLENGLLSTDLARNVSLYTLTLGRRIAYTKSLEGLNPQASGFEGVMRELLKERDEKFKRVRDSNLPQAQKDKESTKLAKSFKKVQKRVQAYHDVAMGSYSIHESNQLIRELSRTARAMTHATKLGSLPILQLPDLAVPIFEHGVFRWARDGLVPMLSHMNGIIKTEAGVKWRKTSSEAGLALERSMNSKNHELWNIQTESTQSNAGKVADGFEGLAKISNIATLSASIENMNQNLIANISQGSLIDKLYKFKAGTLSKNDTMRLLKVGIQPETDGQIILKAFEDSPTSVSKKGGGYASDYWDWDNYEARNMMTAAIRKSVSGTLIKRGMFDSPLMASDPVMSMVFTYTGWYFAALNRFVIPALQNPADAYLMQGTIMTLGLGMLVDPLRRWTRGEEFRIDDKDWFNSAFSSSPPFAPLYSAAMRANSLIDSDFLNKMKNDRYRKVSALGGVAGASVGLAENIHGAARMFAHGKWNQKDWRGFVNSLPVINTWYTNKLKNDFLESATGHLPKNYDSAPE